MLSTVWNTQRGSRSSIEKRKGRKEIEVTRRRGGGTITHLEPDILECEVKWALGSITTNKASGGDGIQLSSFKSYKMIL